VNARPRNPDTHCRLRTYISGLPGTGNPPIAPPPHVHMTHRLSESGWEPPSVDRILFNFDRIYASGIFCRVVSPQLLESQSRIMSAIALMAEKLKATLGPHDQSPPGNRRPRYAPQFNCQYTYSIYFHRFFTTSSSQETKHDTLIMRHQRERRLYTEAVKRTEKDSPLYLEPTTANIALVYNQLTTSLEFWEDAKFWCGMPWWRKPQLDFPWAPPRLSPETLDHSPPPARPLSIASSDSRRTVTFGEGEKDSSPVAPALTRVPRCSTSTRFELSVVRPLLSRAKPISV